MGLNKNVSTSAILAAMGMMVTSPAQALRNQDMSGNDSGAAAVYLFDENGGDTAFDTSGVAPALNLKVKTDGNLPTQDGTPILKNAQMMGNIIYVNPKPNGAETGDPMMADKGYESAQRHRTFLISADSSGTPVTADKLNSCSNGFTIQAFVRPYFPFQGNDSGNLIVGLSNSMANSNNPSAATSPVNFGLYQTGMAGAEAVQLQVRNAAGAVVSQTSVAGGFSSVRAADNPGRFTELIATMDAQGLMTVYVNRSARSSITPFNRGFLNSAHLVIGNDLIPLQNKLDNGQTVIDVSKQRNWSGEIAHLAIYCRSFTRAEILGAVALNKASSAVVKPAKTAVADTRIQARKMVERLTGGPIPVDHPMVVDVEAKLIAGDRVAAAKIVTGDAAAGLAGHPDFLNVVVKQLAAKMSNREETIRVPLNDMSAYFIGITRDERSAKELLTEDAYYMADTTKANVRSDMFNDLLLSNNHYEDLDNGHWDLGKVLVRKTGQQIATTMQGAYTPNPDPAGVLTSRAFMSAHAIAGTNRRLVEYAFREFMCVPMSEMADTSASPARIGRDIDRLPGGDAMKFETSCKGCHTVMDGFRGAFSHYDFASTAINNVTYNFVRNAQVSAKNTAFGFPNGTVDSNGVVRKMTHNEATFPNGFLITDDSFVNNAVGLANKSLFGWRGAQARGGFGVNQFGRMIADSTRFSQCMAKRVYETVCQTAQKSDSKVTPVVESLALKFEASGYKLRSLFQEAAANPACASGQGR